jgi:hypothetical protein
MFLQLSKSRAAPLERSYRSPTLFDSMFINVCSIFCEEAESKSPRSAHMQRAPTQLAVDARS